jgi:hypothetical protein
MPCARCGRGSARPSPASTMTYRRDGESIDDYRVFIDLAPLFAEG